LILDGKIDAKLHGGAIMALVDILVDVQYFQYIYRRVYIVNRATTLTEANSGNGLESPHCSNIGNIPYHRGSHAEWE
jgi:hypothetical protein